MDTSTPSLGSLLHKAGSSSPYLLEESRWDDSQRVDFVDHLLCGGWFGSQTVVEGSDRLRCLLEPGNMVVDLTTLRVGFEDGDRPPSTLPLSLFLVGNAAPKVRATLRGQSLDVLLAAAAEVVLVALSWPAVPVFMTGQNSLAMSRWVVRNHNRFR